MSESITMQPPETLLVTAGNLAAKLGITRQAVHKQLAGIPPSTTARFKGQTAAAWALVSLPAGLRHRIAVARQQRGFRTDAEFLTSDVEPWQPPRPFNDLPADARAEAAQWREILTPLLAQQHTLAAADFLAQGLTLARQILGRTISDDTLRRRFDLAVARDRGFAQWTRLDLYVAEAAYEAPQCATAAASAPAVIVPPSSLWPDLPDRLADMESKLNPTAEDRFNLLDAAFRQLESLMDANQGNLRESKLKGRLGELLLQAVPALSKNLPALQRTFDRELTFWRTHGRSVDAMLARRDKCGRKAAKLCPNCRVMVKGAAVDLDGNLAQAWRRLMLPPKFGGIRAGGKGLCDMCAALWHYNVRRNKSYVPASVRADIGPEIKVALNDRHGRKAAKLASPYTKRDPQDIGPGDFYEADDVTWNHTWYLWDKDASGRPYVGRGECLALADRRAHYIVAYILIAGAVDEDGKQIAARYNATHIRKLILRGNDSLGIPHRGFILENGVWGARLIDGEPQRNWEFNPWRKTEHGLRDPRLGLSIEDAVRHAEAGNPRTKVIERIFRTIQERMRPQAAFVGFNERMDRREKMQDFLRRVRAGNEDPANELMSMAQFSRLLDDELMSYAREPQNGDWLPGVSPLEAWQNGIGGKPGIMDRPLRKLEDSDRAWLASHRRVAHVTGQGIRLRTGGKVRVFWGDSLIPYQHRDIQVALNLEEPELLHCLPKDGKFFTLHERVLPSSTATREQLAETGAARRRWIKAGKVAFDNLPHPLRTSITRDTTDPAIRAEGDYINAATAAHREAQRQERRQAQRIEKAAATLGAVATVNPKRAAQQEAALARMQKRALAAAAAAPSTDCPTS